MNDILETWNLFMTDDEDESKQIPRNVTEYFKSRDISDANRICDRGYYIYRLFGSEIQISLNCPPCRDIKLQGHILLHLWPTHFISSLLIDKLRIPIHFPL